MFNIFTSKHDNQITEWKVYLKQGDLENVEFEKYVLKKP